MRWIYQATRLFLWATATVVLAAGSAHAADRVYPRPEAVEPLAVGTQVPSVRVATVRGDPVSLREAMGDRGALLVFYRGGWWPYCRTQLGGLREVQSELSALGFPVIAISADRPAKLVKSLEEQDLGFTLYSDSSLTAARAFGIVWQLTDAEIARYKGYGVDLEAVSGRNHHQLPVPSVFLVDANGTIRWVYSNPDYRVRPDNATLLDAARRFTSQPPP